MLLKRQRPQTGLDFWTHCFQTTRSFGYYKLTALNRLSEYPTSADGQKL
jgi:hypothetical protein